MGVFRRWFGRLRGGNLLIVATTQLLVQYALIARYSGRTELPWPHFLLFVGVTVCIAAAGYVINDLMDLETDRINKPAEQWVGVHVPVRAAWALYAVLVAAGGGTAWYLADFVGEPHLQGIYWLAVAALWAYSRWLKGRPFWGNLVVSLFTAFVVWIVWFANRHTLALFAERQPQLWVRLASVVWAYCGFAFLSTMVRELVKDMEDLEGDRAAGLRTLPVAYGLAFAKKLALALLALLGAGMALAAFWSMWHFRAWPAAALLSGLLVAAWQVGRLLRQAAHREDFTRASRRLKWIMVGGLLAALLV